MATGMEPAAAAGLVGVALWQLAGFYRDTAPPLGELRRADPDEVDHRQRLLDADLMVGGLALLAGGAASWLMRSWIPIVIVALGFAWVSGWHHLVMGSLTPDQI
jgi:hypothetical protein